MRFPPLLPFIRSSYSGLPLVLEARLPSESAINRHVRNAAQPRERCVSWKTRARARQKRALHRHFRAAASHTTAASNCATLGYAPSSSSHRWRVSWVRNRPLSFPSSRRAGAGAPLCSSSTKVDTRYHRRHTCRGINCGLLIESGSIFSLRLSYLSRCCI